MANMDGINELSDDVLRQFMREVQPYIRDDGTLNYSEACRNTSYARSTVARRWAMAQDRNLNTPQRDVTLPDFPDEDISVEEIIAYQKKRFRKRKESFDSHTWFPVTLKSNKPIGIFWFGDPHVDDDGCDWDILERDIRLCNETEGLYGANIGDTTNNWAGRLVRLYAEQETSVKTARRMAEWLMLDSGVTWLIWILGNHDAWGDGSAILAEMAKRHGTQKLVCHDWEARFSLSFPNGWTPRIYAAHDFKGHSQWNPMHGPMKAGMMGDEADLYVAGHKHNAGYMFFENASRQRWQHFLRVRGYKFLDDYARRLGLPEQEEGCGAITIFDPAKQRVSVYLDVEEGVAALKAKRS